MAGEQRRSARIERKAEAYLWLSGQQKQQATQIQVGDVSEGGLGLLTSDKLSQGQEVWLSLRSWPGRVWPEIKGVVAWQAEASHLSTGARRVGISFSDMDTGIRNRIRDWLEAPEVIAEEPESESALLARTICPAYDGSTITYRVLRAFGWGPLNNLGYFYFPAPFDAANLLVSLLCLKVSFLLPEVQMRLARRSIRLLAIERGEQVLDIACGRGMSSYVMAHLYPDSYVTGLDLLPENAQAATTLYRTPNLEFTQGNAMDLEYVDGIFSKALCLEAAFHFPSRARFLQEAYRVLAEGGRLVVVDFMWKTSKDREILNYGETRLVRDVWKWDDFSSLDEYLETAKSVGFEIEGYHNWSRWVTGPLEFVFKTVAWLGLSRWRRALLVRLNPLLCGITSHEWNVFWESALAHDYVRRRIEYVALVLRKAKKGASGFSMGRGPVRRNGRRSPF